MTKTVDIGKRVDPWKPETDPVRISILGKTQEECNELGIELARCIIQGIDETNPTTNELNRWGLADELDDMETMIKIIREEFKIPRNYDRQHLKYRAQQTWYGMTDPTRLE